MLGDWLPLDKIIHYPRNSYINNSYMCIYTCLYFITHTHVCVYVYNVSQHGKNFKNFQYCKKTNKKQSPKPHYSWNEYKLEIYLLCLLRVWLSLEEISANGECSDIVGYPPQKCALEIRESAVVPWLSRSLLRDHMHKCP